MRQTKERRVLNYKLQVTKMTKDKLHRITENNSTAETNSLVQNQGIHAMNWCQKLIFFTTRQLKKES